MFHIPAQHQVDPAKKPAQSNFDALIDQPAVNEMADKLLEGSDLALQPLPDMWYFEAA